MEALRTHDIGEGGDMETELISVNVGEGLAVTERYVGPSAWWIAHRLSHPVRFEHGWFWTTATCHGVGPDELAFRQRPDGNGIDASCPDGSCSPQVAADALGSQAGWLVRGPTAYEPLTQPVDRLWWLTDWPGWRIAWYGAGVLAVSASLLLGHGPEAAILNFIGFSAGSWLTTRLLMRRRAGRFRR